MYGITISTGKVKMITALHEKGTLQKHLERAGGFSNIPFSVRLRWAKEIATALAHIHQKDIVHNDLHTENILLAGKDGQEHIVLTDFGQSCYLSVS